MPAIHCVPLFALHHPHPDGHHVLMVPACTEQAARSIMEDNPHLGITAREVVVQYKDRGRTIYMFEVAAAEGGAA